MRLAFRPLQRPCFFFFSVAAPFCYTDAIKTDIFRVYIFIKCNNADSSDACCKSRSKNKTQQKKHSTKNTHKDESQNIIVCFYSTIKKINTPPLKSICTTTNLKNYCLCFMWNINKHHKNLLLRHVAGSAWNIYFLVVGSACKIIQIKTKFCFHLKRFEKNGFWTGCI